MSCHMDGIQETTFWVDGGVCPKLSAFLMSSTMYIIMVFWSLNVIWGKNMRFGVVATTFWRLRKSFWSDHNMLLSCLTIIMVIIHSTSIFSKLDVENNPYRTARFFFVVNFPRLEWSKWYPDRPCMDSCCLWRRLWIWQSRTSCFQVPNFRE